MVNLRTLPGFAIFLGMVCNLSAQSIGTLQRQAERNLNRGNYAEAGAQFERAGRLKQSDPTLLFRAAEAFNQARDYFNASNCYQSAKSDARFPLAGLLYARSLKQQGQYEAAREAFQKAAENYHGDQKALVLQVIENEIVGCDLAMELQKQVDSNALETRINWLPPPVASGENHFAPLPFSDTLLYFTAAAAPQSILMRSAKRTGIWQLPVEAGGLPVSASKNFLCGSFSTDGQRFYFTRSDDPPLARLGSSVQTSSAVLYVLRRNKDGDWGEPERLRPYINLEGSSNMWPFVCDYGAEEWLFFASNRPGGMGGVDLYLCKRPLNSDGLDFSFPQNLGNKVNTGADETTPYYDVFTKTLWFSSIGHPGLGGLDVHSSVREGRNWTRPENAGIPVNSPADDMFFVLKRNGSGAFLSSNRTIPKEKEPSINDDLFEVFFQFRD